MIVRLTAAGAVVLDADDCTALHLETQLRGGKLRAALATTDTGAADADGEHVWLDLAVLRSRAKLVATAGDWAQRWTAMVGYAREQGWLSRDGRSVRVHVESPG
jgi:hypothetical protein